MRSKFGSKNEHKIWGENLVPKFGWKIEVKIWVKNWNFMKSKIRFFKSGLKIQKESKLLFKMLDKFTPKAQKNWCKNSVKTNPLMVLGKSLLYTPSFMFFLCTFSFSKNRSVRLFQIRNKFRRNRSSSTIY